MADERGGRGDAIDAAAQWYARLSSGAATPAERAAFAAWRDADPAHAAAMSELAGMLGIADEAFADRNAPAALFEPPPPAQASDTPARSWTARLAGRPRALVAALAIALILTVGVGAGRHALVGPSYAAYASEVGARRTVTLSDGSTVELNTETRIEVALDGAQRLVRLEAGEAYFDVAPDRERPFVVAVGPRVVTVTGTEFNLRRLGEETELVVVEGSVRLSGERRAFSRYAQDHAALSAGMAARFAPRRPASVRDGVSADLAAAWRRGQLIYRDVPLDRVIADLNRYFEGRIRVRGGVAARLRVNAVIQLSDRETVLNALARQLPIRVDYVDDLNAVVSLSRES